MQSTHPVDVDYLEAVERRPEILRPLAEVVLRGVFLPEGQVRCVTCHDRTSSLPYRWAIPASAVSEDAPFSSKPLCLLCHKWT